MGKFLSFFFFFFLSFLSVLYTVYLVLYSNMNGLDPPNIQQTVASSSCLLAPEIQPFEPQAEDILTDEDLLDLFRIVKQVLRKNPDSEKLAKLLFCMSYALGDHIKFSKPCHEDRIVFRDNHSAVHSVRLPSTSSCCSNTTTTTTTASLYSQVHRASTSSYSHHHSDLLRPEKDSVQKWIDSSSVTSTTSPSPISPLTRLPSVSYLTNANNIHSTTANTTSLSEISNDNVSSSDPYSVRPFSNFRPLYTLSSSPAHHQSPTITSTAAAVASPIVNGNSPSIPSPSPMHHPSSIGDTNDGTPDHSNTTIAIGNHTTGSTTDHHRYTSINSTSSCSSIQQFGGSNTEVVMEPQQRGFYYQDGRIAREPVLLQRYAEQGILTQASLMRKCKRNSADANSPYEISNLPVPTKKPKIPHRHGEFEQRREYYLI
jgi:hypothetical protein